MARKRFRVVLFQGVYYPQRRFLWVWLHFEDSPHGVGYQVNYPTLAEAQEHIYRHIDQVERLRAKPVPPIEVWWC